MPNVMDAEIEVGEVDAGTTGTGGDTGASTKVAQILAAAREIFLQQGYGATSMDGIARTAKVSKATVYAHFPSKAELFGAIFAAECANFRQDLAFPAADTPVDEILYRIGRSFLDLVLRPHVLAALRVVIAETPRFPELGRAFYQAGPVTSLNHLARLLEAETARGRLAVEDPDMAAEQFIGMVKSRLHICALLSLHEDMQVETLDRTVRAAVRTFLRAYAPDESRLS